MLLVLLVVDVGVGEEVGGSLSMTDVNSMRRMEDELLTS